MTTRSKQQAKRWPALAAVCLAALVAACVAPLPDLPPDGAGTSTAQPPTPAATSSPTPDIFATPLPTREPFAVGHTLPYTAQSGDTLTAIAAHFNTSSEEVLALNPGLPSDATIAPGTPLTIPAYWFPLGGSAYKIIPDSAFVYGPTSVGFDVHAYVMSQPGFLRELSSFVAGRQRSSGNTVLYVAQQYSINPRLLLALMEWRTGALTNPDAPTEARENPFGRMPARGLYGQLRYVAEQMSAGYYGWRTGDLTSLLLRDSTRSRPDMYQTGGSVAVQYLFAQIFDFDEFEAAIAPEGFGATYIRLWGDPFKAEPLDVIPGDLAQPELALPFVANQRWSFTGGPHPPWGQNLPWAALDFAPPGIAGCMTTQQWVTAAADGVVVRSGEYMVVLDLDGDGYEQTGWVLFHLHIADEDRVPAGTVVKAGDPLGHPSCEGGRATGTHVHIARKYNGEWIPADGIVPGVVAFELGGWTAVRGAAPYQGRMTRIGAWVEACTCSTAENTVYWAR
jgi:LasA protease